MKIFNDNIHGRIKVPDYCVSIIDTVAFQRLRNLKQLGLTSYVFYGATHTRFEHSIGTCYIAGEWIRSLKSKHDFITDKDVKIIDIAGLIHDLGHGPYSHTFEKFIKIVRPETNYRHELMTVILFKEIAKQIIEQDIIDEVCNLILGKCSKNYLQSIINNTSNGLDADKLDYFIRDSQCTSFAIGCDWKRIVYESSIKDDNIVFPYKMVGDIFNLYQIRFRLYKEVYFHKSVIKLENQFLSMLKLANELLMFNGRKLSDTIDDINSFLLTNDDILGQLERCQNDAIQKKLLHFKTRKFELFDTFEGGHVAHYGMHQENPIKFVKFIDKSSNYKEIEDDILDSMCPKKFYL